MSVETDKHTKHVTFHCDNCPEYFTIDSKEFRETLEAMKKAKWAYKKEDDDGWSHYCPSCKD